LNRTMAWLLLLVPVLAWLPTPCTGAVPGYYYASQSFDVSIYDGGASIFVAQSASLYCYEGSLDQVDITLPYGAGEIPGLEDTLLVQTDTARKMEAEVERGANLTIIRVTLPERIYQGEDQVIIAKYTLSGLKERGGATLGDRLLGREGRNTVVRFKTPTFEAQVTELIVRIYPPADEKPKDWSPRTDSSKTWRADGRLGIIWHLTSGIPDEGEFELVFGEGGWGITALDLAGISIVVLFILLHHRRKTRRQRASSE
jgi:hypothetical protein